jgi:hypothetical protein
MAVSIISIAPIHSTQLKVYSQTDQAVLVVWSSMSQTDYTTIEALDCAGYTKITVGIFGEWGNNQLGWGESLSGFKFNAAYSNLSSVGSNAVANDTPGAGANTERIHTLLRVPRYIQPALFGALGTNFSVTPFALCY